MVKNKNTIFFITYTSSLDFFQLLTLYKKKVEKFGNYAYPIKLLEDFYF